MKYFEESSELRGKYIYVPTFPPNLTPGEDATPCRASDHL